MDAGALLVRTIVGLAALALVIWRVRHARVARKVADLALVEDLIEEAIESTPNASTAGIRRIVLRDLGERGYPERVMALATVDYVEEVQRAKKRRTRPRKRSSV